MKNFTKEISELKKENSSINNIIIGQFDLQPIFDTKKSFYSKAQIVLFENVKKQIALFSYNICVCIIYNNNVYITNNMEHYTTTTLRHIKEFLTQYGYKADTKKQIINDYIQTNLL